MGDDVRRRAEAEGSVVRSSVEETPNGLHRELRSSGPIWAHRGDAASEPRQASTSSTRQRTARSPTA